MSSMAIATWVMVGLSLIMNALTVRNILRTRRYQRELDEILARR